MWLVPCILAFEPYFFTLLDCFHLNLAGGFRLSPFLFTLAAWGLPCHFFLRTRVDALWLELAPVLAENKFSKKTHGLISAGLVGLAFIGPPQM